jgi:hypothetical protein
MLINVAGPRIATPARTLSPCSGIAASRHRGSATANYGAIISANQNITGTKLYKCGISTFLTL